MDAFGGDAHRQHANRGGHRTRSRRAADFEFVGYPALSECFPRGAGRCDRQRGGKVDDALRPLNQNTLGRRTTQFDRLPVDGCSQPSVSPGADQIRAVHVGRAEVVPVRCGPGESFTPATVRGSRPGGSTKHSQSKPTTHQRFENTRSLARRMSAQHRKARDSQRLCGGHFFGSPSRTYPTPRSVS